MGVKGGGVNKILNNKCDLSKYSSYLLRINCLQSFQFLSDGTGLNNLTMCTSEIIV